MGGREMRAGTRSLGEGERQMDRSVREAAGYRQGRNCVSGARCQKYVSIMQIEGGKKAGEKSRATWINIVFVCIYTAVCVYCI